MAICFAEFRQTCSAQCKHHSYITELDFNLPRNELLTFDMHVPAMCIYLNEPTIRSYIPSSDIYVEFKLQNIILIDFVHAVAY